MITRIEFWVSALLALAVGASFSAGGANRNTNADLVSIATRFVGNYSRAQHKAGDEDGMFVENVVIPSVVNVADSYKGKIPSIVRNELYRFLIAGKSMASEELSMLAGKLYLASPKQFCRDVSNKRDRRLLIRYANDGLALSGVKVGKVMCA